MNYFYTAGIRPEKQTGLHTFAITTIAFSTASIMTRFASRATIEKKVKWDDWTALLGWLVATMTQLTIIFTQRRGFGRHVDDIPEENVVACLLALFIAAFLFETTMSIISCSVLLNCLRHFNSPPNFCRSYQKIARFGLCGILLHFVIFVGLTLGNCTPIQANWQFFDYNDVKYHVGLNIMVVWIALQGAVSSIGILFTPAFKVWEKRRRWARNIGATLSFILFAGVPAVIAARAASLIQAKGKEADPTWIFQTPLLYYTIEIFAARLLSDFPVVYPFLKAVYHDDPNVVGIWSMGNGVERPQANDRSTQANHGATQTNNGSTQANSESTQTNGESTQANDGSTQVNAGSAQVNILPTIHSDDGSERANSEPDQVHSGSAQHDDETSQDNSGRLQESGESIEMDDMSNTPGIV